MVNPQPSGLRNEKEFVSSKASIAFLSIMNYIGYFIVSLLYNIILLALYIVQASINHRDCTSDDGVNVTSKYQTSFVIGLNILALDFVNTNII